MIDKTAKALRDLNYYIRQQRKQQVVIYTNDKMMKRLIEKAHPNAIVEYLEIPKPSKTDERKPLSVVLRNVDMDKPNPIGT